MGDYSAETSSLLQSRLDEEYVRELILGQNQLCGPVAF
jgi:hypothetical protein